MSDFWPKSDDPPSVAITLGLFWGAALAMVGFVLWGVASFLIEAVRWFA